MFLLFCFQNDERMYNLGDGGWQWYPECILRSITFWVYYLLSNLIGQIGSSGSSCRWRQNLVPTRHRHTVHLLVALINFECEYSLNNDSLWLKPVHKPVFARLSAISRLLHATEWCVQKLSVRSVNGNGTSFQFCGNSVSLRR